MRVLHVITSLRTGGAEKLMVDLLPRLRDRGAEVELAVFDGTDTQFMSRIDDSGIAVHKFATGGSVYNPRHILRLRKLVGEFDIVHTHNTAPQFFAPLASVGKKKMLVTTEHSTSNRRRDMPAMSVADKWMYARYNRIVCISRKAETNLREYLHEPSEGRFLTIENGIDLAKYANAAPSPEMERLKANENITAIVNVAAFRHEKDQPTLIRSLTSLPRRFHLFLVGDGVRRGEYEALVSEFGLTDRVHLTGVRQDVPQLLKSADFLVLSSHFEGLSLSSVEAMAAGHPVIASNVDGLREVVDGAGILFPHGDDRQLADEIIRLDSDPVMRNEISRRCRLRSADYDIEKMADRYYELYCRL